MNLRDIIEGYQVIRKLKKDGYVQDDEIGLGEFIRMVFQVERNIRVREKEELKKRYGIKEVDNA